MKRGLKALPAVLVLSLFISPLAPLGPMASGAPRTGFQTGTDDAATAAAVQSIRRQYAAVNKRAGRYRKVRKKLSGYSLEGGELVAYLDGPALVKVVAIHYGEGGRTREEYYYQQGKLIFVFQKEFRYDRPLSGKVVRTTVNRYYFENERLIRWLGEDGKQVASGSAEYQKAQDEFVEASRKFSQAAHSKVSTIEAEN